MLTPPSAGSPRYMFMVLVAISYGLALVSLSGKVEFPGLIAKDTYGKIVAVRLPLAHILGVDASTRLRRRGIGECHSLGARPIADIGRGEPLLSRAQGACGTAHGSAFQI